MEADPGVVCGVVGGVVGVGGVVVGVGGVMAAAPVLFVVLCATHATHAMWVGARVVGLIGVKTLNPLGLQIVKSL